METDAAVCCNTASPAGLAEEQILIVVEQDVQEQWQGLQGTPPSHMATAPRDMPGYEAVIFFSAPLIWLTNMSSFDGSEGVSRK